jgi:flavin-dependent dehydrogenase
MNTSQEFFDVVIIGGGPGGSVLAACLAQAGASVLILEMASFPRYHIGESLTGMAAVVLDDFGLSAEMDRRQFPRKDGVKVIGKGADSEFWVPVFRPTWQVRRAEFDQILLDNAIRRGATYRQARVNRVLRDGETVTGAVYTVDGEQNQREVRCRVLADASGQAALLSRLDVAGTLRRTEFDKQVAVFSQFRGARRDPGTMGDNTFLFYSETYHWAWFIPVSPDVVSIGIVLPGEEVKRLGGAEAAFRWGVERINPDLAWRLPGCEQMEPIRAAANYSYAVDPFVGPGWLAVGDAHQFIDPIFSFGVTFAMLEAREASRAILASFTNGDWREPFTEYRDFCVRGQTAALDLISYFWKFPVFFGYQSRGELRQDIIRLLSSDAHSKVESRALAQMRKALRRPAAA